MIFIFFLQATCPCSFLNELLLIQGNTHQTSANSNKLTVYSTGPEEQNDTHTDDKCVVTDLKGIPVPPTIPVFSDFILSLSYTHALGRPRNVLREAAPG